MDSYFFVPGNKLFKFASIQSLKVEQIIIDLEDAVKRSQIAAITEELKIGFEKYKSSFIRVPIVGTDQKIDTELLCCLQGIGFKNFVLPKLNNIDDFEGVLAKTKSDEVRIILLVETPRLLAQCDDLLSRYNRFFVGLGLGSHDFMATIGGKHTIKNLEFARQRILYVARSNNIQAIDIVSMELKNRTDFMSEVKDGFEKGYDGKFLIHPWQFDILRNADFYTLEEYEWALKIDSLMQGVGSLDEFSAITVEGQVVEKPHWNKVQKIIKYYERYETK